MSIDFEGFVLAASTADLGDEPAARQHADAVEFRMDLAADPLAALADYGGDLPLLVTNRTAREGGEAADEDARFAALRTAAERDAVAAVDLELATLDDEAGERTAAHAREHDCAVVASVHDFEGTPRGDLDDLLAAAAAAGDVGKLAVRAENRGDALALLRATHDATAAGDRVATMAMGEPGRHTRAVAPLYGSRIGYAPVDPAEATAPGQYDLATLRDLVTRLDGTADGGTVRTA